MIYYIDKGASKTISRVAINTGGGVLNLTGAVITITAKQFGNASSTLFTKTSADSSEIEIINSTLGLFLVKLNSGDTSALNYKSLYCQQTITIDSTAYSDVFIIKLKGITTGIPIESFVLSPAKYVVWKSVNGAAPIRILKAGFSGDVAASIVGSTVTLTSVSGEFEGQGEFDSNSKDHTITVANTTTITAVFDSLSARTISFWYGDPTKINISNSGYVTPSTTSQISKGTTAERIATGATLGVTDVFVWTDTTENTTYTWNGSEWV